jgi:hypothetical protein
MYQNNEILVYMFSRNVYFVYQHLLTIWRAFCLPTYWRTIPMPLYWGSNINTDMLWTLLGWKENMNERKGFRTKLSHVSTCIIIGLGFHNQKFDSHWNQMCNNPIKFGKPRRLLKQMHNKIANNFSFGSTHIFEPHNPKHL